MQLGCWWAVLAVSGPLQQLLLAFFDGSSSDAWLAFSSGSSCDDWLEFSVGSSIDAWLASVRQEESQDDSWVLVLTS